MTQTIMLHPHTDYLLNVVFAVAKLEIASKEVDASFVTNIYTAHRFGTRTRSFSNAVMMR